MRAQVKQAVFLIGGMGTRLGDLTKSVPKPLLPVAGRPFLDYLIDNAVRQGFNDIILLCGYLSGIVADHYSDVRFSDRSVRLVVEPEPAGTGGALRYAEHLLDDAFILANGDSFFALDWRAFADFALGRNAPAVLALRDRAPGSRYGTVSLKGERIEQFHNPADKVDGPMNAGIYLVRKSILQEIKELPCSIEQQLFPTLAAGGRLLGKVSSGYFIDIGLPEDFSRAQSEIPAITGGGHL